MMAQKSGKSLTLIEVLAAATVLAIGLLGLLSAMVSGQNQSVATIDELNAANILQSRVEEIMTYSKSSFPIKVDGVTVEYKNIDALIAKLKGMNADINAIIPKAAAGQYLNNTEKNLLEWYNPAILDFPVVDKGGTDAIRCAVNVKVYLSETQVPVELGGDPNVGASTDVYYNDVKSFARLTGPLDLNGNGTVSETFTDSLDNDGYMTYWLTIVPVEVTVSYRLLNSSETRTLRQFIMAARMEMPKKQQ